LELAYENYRRKEVEKYIAENYSDEQFSELIERKRREMEPKYKISRWAPESVVSFLNGAVRAEIEKMITFTTYQAFCEEERKRPHQLDLPEEGSTLPSQSQTATNKTATPPSETTDNFTV
jgi:hypothetical protein